MTTTSKPDSKRLGAAIQGANADVLMISFTKNGKDSWFEFDGDNRWVPAEAPHGKVKYLLADEEAFLKAFAARAYEESEERVKKRFAQGASLGDFLFAGDSLAFNKLDARDKTTLETLARNSKITLTAAKILGYLPSAPRELGDTPVYVEEAERAPEGERKEASEHNRIAMRDAKVMTGAIIGIMGAGLGITQNRNISSKKESGEAPTWGDRVLQVGVWSATVAAVLYAAVSMWNSGAKASSPTR